MGPFRSHRWLECAGFLFGLARFARCVMAWPARHHLPGRRAAALPFTPPVARRPRPVRRGAAGAPVPGGRRNRPIHREPAGRICTNRRQSDRPRSIGSFRTDARGPRRSERSPAGVSATPSIYASLARAWRDWPRHRVARPVRRRQDFASACRSGRCAGGCPLKETVDRTSNIFAQTEPMASFQRFRTPA
jgi:hypothetical protein